VEADLLFDVRFGLDRDEEDDFLERDEEEDFLERDEEEDFLDISLGEGMPDVFVEADVTLV